MQKRKIITREVDQGKEYPPPVLYGLSPNARALNGSWLFENYVKENIFKTEKDEITLKASKKTPKFEDIPWEKAPQLIRRLLPEIADDKERLAAIVRRLGVFYLFALLKSIDEGNYDWMLDVKSLLDYDQTVEAALGFGVPEQKYKRIQITQEGQPSKRLIEDLVINTSPLVFPSKETIEKTLELLKQTFPQEKEFLNSITDFKEFTKTSLSKQSES